jgi:hypothetical protein
MRHITTRLFGATPSQSSLPQAQYQYSLPN